jgi:large subunit ribosomal protein L24e
MVNNFTSMDSADQHLHRMAVARERLLAHRRKKALTQKPSSVKLVEPMVVDSNISEPSPEKIKVRIQRKSALVAGEGRTMGMDMDMD